jgi:hypothetical protein
VTTTSNASSADLADQSGSLDGLKKDKFGYSCGFDHFANWLRDPGFEKFMGDCHKLLAFTIQQVAKAKGPERFSLPPTHRKNWNYEGEQPLEEAEEEQYSIADSQALQLLEEDKHQQQQQQQEEVEEGWAIAGRRKKKRPSPATSAGQE